LIGGLNRNSKEASVMEVERKVQFIHLPDDQV